MNKPAVDYDLEAIITRYKPLVTFRVRKSLGTWTPDWEDVVAEIMTNVIEKIQNGDFKGESSLGTFIYTITTRRIIDFIREKRKIIRHAPEPDPFLTPDEYIDNKERAAKIAKAIQKLKPQHKELIYLYYYRELTYEEIAQKIGISPRKVGERIYYARDVLKKMIKK
ncbi:MAG: RNA polymerase sigma factor [Acidobacteriota bacterium]